MTATTTQSAATRSAPNAVAIQSVLLSAVTDSVVDRVSDEGGKCDRRCGVQGKAHDNRQ